MSPPSPIAPTVRTLKDQVADTCPAPARDPWVALFEGSAPTGLKQDFLARGCVDLDAHPDRPTELLMALVRGWQDARHEGGYGHDVLELPGSLSEPWPDRGADGENASDGALVRGGCPPEALLSGRLLAAGARAFPATDGREGMDLLDLALHRKWGGLLLRLLKSPDLPPVGLLQARKSGPAPERGRPSLPWTHTLAHDGRAGELAAWLEVLGMDPNAQDDRGQTPLFFASSPAIVQILLASGADPNHRARDGRSILSEWKLRHQGMRRFHGGEARWDALVASIGSAPEDQDTMDLVHGWAHGKLPSWGQCSSATKAALSALRMPVVPPSKMGEPARAPFLWGAVAYLGLKWQIPLPRLAACEKWCAQMPQILLDHESVPGLPDGMVLLARAYVSSDQSTELACILAERLRINPIHGGVPRPGWRNSLFQAMACLLENAPPPERLVLEKKAADLLLELLEQSGWESAAAAPAFPAAWCPKKGSAGSTPEDVAAIVETGLASPHLRPMILDAAPWLLQRLGVAGPVGSKGAAWNAVWEGLLAIHKTQFDRENTKGVPSVHALVWPFMFKDGPAPSPQEQLELLMGRWIRDGHLPTHPRVLRVLTRRLYGMGDEGVAHASLIASQRLEASVGPAAPTKPIRPRM